MRATDTIVEKSVASEPTAPSFRVMGFGPTVFQVICDCDPEMRWSSTWFVQEDMPFNFKCANPECGRRFVLNLQVQWKEVE